VGAVFLAKRRSVGRYPWRDDVSSRCAGRRQGQRGRCFSQNAGRWVVSVASDDVSWRCAGRRQGQRGRGLQAAVWLAGSTEAEAEESVLRRFRLGGVSSSMRRAAAGVALAWPTGGMAGR
jgi:hypothetical protein